MADALTWTIGAGGLIGSAVDAKASRRFSSTPIPWNTAGADTALTENLERFRQEAGESPWTIVWAAGAATVSSDDNQTKAETAVLEKFLIQLRAAPPSGSGVFFLASSAGGLFAGATHPPFSEASEPHPISPYGHAKLANELLARELLADTCPVVIGRFSNIYGPGQKLTKLQGLISRLVLSAATREPINVFVPLSTVRDYIYVDDAATATHIWIDDAHASAGTGAAVRLIASGQGTSVGQLVRITQDVSHRKVPIAMGSHSSSAVQAADLRFIPSTPSNVVLPVTSMPVGVKRVVDAILLELQTKPSH
jgi:UDP-glucose 4-epimerase